MADAATQPQSETMTKTVADTAAAAPPMKGEEGLERKQIPYSQQERLPPWQWKDIRWTMATYISLMHVLAFAGLFWIPSCSKATLW